MDNFQFVRDIFSRYYDQISSDEGNIQALLAPYLSLQYRRLHDFFEGVGLGAQSVLLEQLYNALFVSPPAPNDDIKRILSQFIMSLYEGNSSYKATFKTIQVYVFRNRDATKFRLSFFSPDEFYAASTMLWHEWGKNLNAVMDDVIRHESIHNYKIGMMIARIKTSLMKEVDFGLSMMKSNKEKFDQWS